MWHLTKRLLYTDLNLEIKLEIYTNKLYENSFNTKLAEAQNIFHAAKFEKKKLPKNLNLNSLTYRTEYKGFYNKKVLNEMSNKAERQQIITISMVLSGAVIQKYSLRIFWRLWSMCSKFGWFSFGEFHFYKN